MGKESEISTNRVLMVGRQKNWGIQVGVRQKGRQKGLGWAGRNQVGKNQRWEEGVSKSPPPLFPSSFLW